MDLDNEDQDVEDTNEELEALKEEALLLVDKVIKGATDTVRDLKKKEEAAAAKYKIPNIQWMECRDFTVGKGLLQIEEYMRVRRGSSTKAGCTGSTTSARKSSSTARGTTTGCGGASPRAASPSREPRPASSSSSRFPKSGLILCPSKYTLWWRQTSSFTGR
ncbi:A-kinase anchor protein 14 isoform X2 [Anolis carolinensis]|uniref:A-kinase anchor protein 14 isoform X2 n=1 Tax=Anolis carolinensis TaxID=28377 RepID=UPI002F2B7A24